MFDRDYDISKKIVEEKQKTFNPRYVVYSIAKSNLKNVMRITKLLTKHNLLYYNGIPIQSTDPTVLRIASRKNLPLADLKKVSDEINFTATPQIILGLPGDNFQRFSQTFVDLIEQGYRNFQVFPFLLLRNSPAYDAEYRKKYKIETIYRHNQRSRRKTHNKEGYSSLNEFVIKTFSFNREEYLKMWYFATFVSSFIRLINSKKPHREFFLELMKKFDFPEIRKKQKEFVYDGGFLEFEYPKISELTTQMYDSEEYMLIEILLNWNTYKKQLAKYDTKNQLDSVIHPDYTGPATHTGPNKEYKLDFIGQTGDEKLKRYVNCIIGTLYKRSARICT